MEPAMYMIIRHGHWLTEPEGGLVPGVEPWVSLCHSQMPCSNLAIEQCSLETSPLHPCT